MKKTLATVPAKWAQIMDSQGKGGSEMLRLYEEGAKSTKPNGLFLCPGAQIASAPRFRE
jgi:hypothetical protein